MALPLPDKPSIAVLPFANLSSDSEQTYFTDGMTEDLITEVSNLSGIFLISRLDRCLQRQAGEGTSGSRRPGRPLRLGGSVRGDGNQVRVNAQLIDAVGGHHLWADRYDSQVSGVFELQDKVIGQIV